MKPLKEKVSITLDSDIVKEIKDMAEKDDRSFSQFVNKVLKEYVNNKRDKQITGRSIFLSVLLYTSSAGKVLPTAPTPPRTQKHEL